MTKKIFGMGRGQEEYYDLSVDVEREYEKIKQQMTEQVQENGIGRN